MTDPTHTDDDEHALRSGLRADALSPEAMARIRAATEAEWRAQVAAAPVTPWWRRGAALAAAASLLVVALGAITFTRSGGGEQLGTLARADGAGLVEHRLLGRDAGVAVGMPLRSTKNYASRGGALLALAGGGNLRVAPGSQFEIQAAHQLRLTKGEVYVDIPPGEHAAAGFVVLTGAGEFRHLGTQFSVALVEDGTRLRVREGRVQWRAEDQAPATVEAGFELRIDAQRNVSRRAIDTVGDSWAWTEVMTPDIEIEDRPLGEFLQWVSRETGRKLVFADEEVRRQIADTRMHGNVRGMTALNALRAVMAATSLRFDLPEGAIRVSLASATPPVLP
jgi:ferric-dicitrate binding protein FerR (iron transport regulator)